MPDAPKPDRPEARLYRTGPVKEAELAHLGHAPGESRHGLVVAVAVSGAGGTAERGAAAGMIDGVAAPPDSGRRPAGRTRGTGGEFLPAVGASG